MTCDQGIVLLLIKNLFSFQLPRATTPTADYAALDYDKSDKAKNDENESNDIQQVILVPGQVQ